MRVVFRQIRPLSVICVRAHGPYAASADAAWSLMHRWLDQRRPRPRWPVGYGLFRDNPHATPAALLRYDACVPLIPDLIAEDMPGMHRQILGGGAYAVHTHVGAYTAMGQIFSKMHQVAVARQMLTVDDQRPFLAIYLNDPAVTREVHRRTEVCIPVHPMRMPVAGNDWGQDDALAAAASA